MKTKVQFLSFYIWIVLLLVSTGCVSSYNSAAKTKFFLTKIENRKELVAWMKKHEGHPVTPFVWNSLAANKQLPDWKRQIAALQFLKQSFKPGMSLRETSRYLKKVDWITSQDIKCNLDSVMMGDLPVKIHGYDSLLVMDIMPKSETTFAKFYCVINGIIRHAEFCDIVLADRKNGQENLIISQIASVEVENGITVTKNAYGVH